MAEGSTVEIEAYEEIIEDLNFSSLVADRVV